MRHGLPRVVAIWLALAIGPTLAAGCAGGAASASETASEQAEARTFAAAVNLSPTDLPGFEVVTGGEEGRPGPLYRPIEQCDGGPIVDGADRGLYSPLIQKQSVPVQTSLSGVYRMANSSIAARYIRAADSRRGLRCIERYEIRKRATLPAGVRGRVEVSALRRPLGGAGVSGVRIWRCLAGPQPCDNSDGFTDRLWFAAGPYVVTLFYIAGARNEAKGREPLALPVERRLIALLFGRAAVRKP